MKKFHLISRLRVRSFSESSFFSLEEIENQVVPSIEKSMSSYTNYNIVKQSDKRKVKSLEKQINEIRDESEAKYSEYESEIKRYEDNLKQSDEMNLHLMVNIQCIYRNKIIIKSKLLLFRLLIILFALKRLTYQ